MFKGAIFDFDGTLYDYELCNDYALNVLLIELSNEFLISLDELSTFYKRMNSDIKKSNNCSNKFNKIIYIKKICENYGIRLEYVQKYLSLYEDKFYEKMKLFEGVIEVFEFLKKSNIKIAIVTNGKFEQQYKKLCYLNIIKYVDVIQTSDECGYEKPSNHIYFEVQNKLNIPFNQLIMVGDNYEHDIIPANKLGMLPFYYNMNVYDCYENVQIYKTCTELLHYFQSYLSSVKDLIELSKYFGQSELNVQGPGGNISVKMDNKMFIKSSGCVMANITPYSDYCVVDNKNIEKLYGYGKPSMESRFHSFMKKYTVHIHFLLSNIFLCSNNCMNEVMKDFSYNYKIVDYILPGKLLSDEIGKIYSTNVDIYLLKNHGIILTGNSKEEIYILYKYMFEFFNSKLKYQYSFDSFLINERLGGLKVVRETLFDKSIFENVKYCFPDMAIFLQKVKSIDTMNELNIETDCDLLIYKNKVYVICDTASKYYSICEIIEHYKELYQYDLKLIENIYTLQNMEEEKYRK